jgi:hypothetical protein
MKTHNLLALVGIMLHPEWFNALSSDTLNDSFYKY